MEINTLPKYDFSDNPADCCPRFKPKGWDNRELHFKDKLFIKAVTRSVFHIPLNMASVFAKTFAAMEKAHAMSEDDFIVLSYDPSPWRSEHYFSVINDVPGQEHVRLSGDYLTKVFAGPYKNVPKWEKEMATLVKSRGKQLVRTYFFYTTCPKCAKQYDENYLVAVSATR